ncbi:MAG: TPM domain-containing protein [Flavobacteriaceae bacterium]|nr:TPM domain-containing protein [Bacteroidia bacterium]MBT8287236.1 TPM domain-containing protein [Bacteroidia bacterium]NNF75594.1 TPM domain-containing protein [Flavobacteriaceae bacterium]NNK72364.1 TPM domain-containing protein [Flavobacteriaceae bacterium]
MDLIEEFLSPKQEQQIIEAIRQAELSSSGEIRIHIENQCNGVPYDRAREIFSLLGMDRTQLKNGVLIYVAVSDHCFAICGDTGINALVPDHFWDDIKEIIQISFSSGEYSDGLTEAVLKIGEQLKSHFPWDSNDTNELPDFISRS